MVLIGSASREKNTELFGKFFYFNKRVLKAFRHDLMQRRILVGKIELKKL